MMTKWENYICGYLEKHGWKLRSLGPRRWWHKDYGERSEVYAVTMQRFLNAEAKRRQDRAA